MGYIQLITLTHPPGLKHKKRTLTFLGGHEEEDRPRGSVEREGIQERSEDAVPVTMRTSQSPIRGEGQREREKSAEEEQEKKEEKEEAEGGRRQKRNAYLRHSRDPLVNIGRLLGIRARREQG